MMTFTDAERTYLLTTTPLGRLASIGPGGAPHNHPVAYRLNPDTETIEIGGPGFGSSQKFRNIQSDPRISFVVDDLATPAHTLGPHGQLGRGLEIRGHAEIVVDQRPLMEEFSTELLRIHPRRIIAWNLDGPGYNARNATPAITTPATERSGRRS